MADHYNAGGMRFSSGLDVSSALSGRLPGLPRTILSVLGVGLRPFAVSLPHHPYQFRDHARVLALAYRLQEQALGGLKPATRRLFEPPRAARRRGCGKSGVGRRPPCVWRITVFPRISNSPHTGLPRSRASATRHGSAVPPQQILTTHLPDRRRTSWSTGLR